MSDLSTVPTSSRAERCDLLDLAPPVDAGQAALSRLLGRGRRIALPDADMALLVLPAPTPTSPSVTGALEPSLRLTLSQGPLWLAQGERLLAGLTGIDVASTRAADGVWPHWLVGALAGRLQNTPLAALQGIDAAVPGQMDAPGMLALQWRLRDGEHAVETTAWASVTLWRTLLDQAEPLRTPAERWLPLAFSSVVPLATHGLSRPAFDALRLGDLILPDNPHFDIAGNGRVVLAVRHWRARYIDHQRLQLLSEENALNYEAEQDAALDDVTPDMPAADYDAAASQQDDAAGEYAQVEPAEYMQQGGVEPAADAAVPGEIRLTLRFELGRLKLSLDQLRALGEQTVLTLHDASAQSIAITSSGVEVGRGEVVSVDGRLGVRITRWSAAC